MKKLLCSIVLLLPLTAQADNDSVYSWGPWSQGIKPAAGDAMRLTPAAVEKPQVNFRPNENSAFSRTVVPSINPAPTNPLSEPVVVELPIEQATNDPRNGRG